MFERRNALNALLEAARLLASFALASFAFDFSADVLRPPPPFRRRSVAPFLT